MTANLKKRLVGKDQKLNRDTDRLMGLEGKLQFEDCQKGGTMENILSFELGLYPQSKGEPEINKS